MSAPQVAQPLCCARCGAEFLAPGVNEALELASCARCRNVMDLGRQRALPPGDAAASRAPRQRPQLTLPRGLHIAERPAGLELRLPRASVEGHAGFQGLSALGLLLGGYVYVLAAGFAVRLEVGVLFGLAGIYLAAAAALNRPRLTVDPAGLAIRWGPLPWPGQRRQFIPKAEVHQLFSERRGIPDRSGNDVSATFAVSAVVGPERRRKVLVRNLPDVDHALWLEQTAEGVLGLTDVPVGGEVER